MVDEQARLDEYRDYYRARAARFAARPEYPETAAAEASLEEAVEQSTSMADLQHRVLGAGLALECGKALARDQANARAALYARTQDDVRAQAPAEILGGLDAVGDAAALANLGAGASQRNAQAVTIDELTRLWSMSLTALENIETWQTARVPAKWRAELDGNVAEAVAAARQGWAQVLATGAQYQPGWRLHDDTARAPRHRRLVAMPDLAFEARLAEHRRTVRGEAG
jgi:hypothetical protein